MIMAYHRPNDLAEALKLLARADVVTRPLGGGTVLSRHAGDNLEVVDLQRLPLNTIEREGQLLNIGATVTLQQLVESQELPEEIGHSLRESLRHEVGLNLRQVATLAGTVVSCDGRSPFVTALLALDPRLIWAPEDAIQANVQDPMRRDEQPLGDYLPLREAIGKDKLILKVRTAMNARLQFAMVARSPMDRPIVCAAVASWPSGRTRVTLGGYGKAPILAMDGPEPGGAVVAAREAYRFAEDAWASAAYRSEVAGKLVQRLLAKETKKT